MDGDLGLVLLWVCGIVQWLLESVHSYVAPGRGKQKIRLIVTDANFLTFFPTVFFCFSYV